MSGVADDGDAWNCQWLAVERGGGSSQLCAKHGKRLAITFAAIEWLKAGRMEFPFDVVGGFFDAGLEGLSSLHVVGGQGAFDLFYGVGINDMVDDLCGKTGHGKQQNGGNS